MSADVLLDLNEATEEQWLAERLNGITGSDILKAIGVENSPLSLWVAKTTGQDPIEPTEAMEWGHRLEPIVAEAFEDRTGIEVVKANVLLAHPEFNWARATPDYLVEDGTGLEIKCVGSYMAHEWENDNVPLRATAQCTWYMAVTGAPAWHVAALIGGNRLETRLVERNDDLIGQLFVLAGEFWQRVLDREMPPVTSGEDEAKALAALFPEHDEQLIELDDAGAEVYRNWLLARDQRDTAETLVELYGNQLRALIGEHEGVTLDGRKVATWKWQTSNRLNTKALRAAHPGIAEEFTYESPSRVLRAHDTKD